MLTSVHLSQKRVTSVFLTSSRKPLQRTRSYLMGEALKSKVSKRVTSLVQQLLMIASQALQLTMKKSLGQ